MDFRSGGAYTLTMEGMGVKHTVRGIYREVVVPERIVQRFEFDETPGVFITTSVTFTERAGKTLLDVRQEFPARETLTSAQRQFLELAMSGAPMGWSQTIDHLVEYVTR